MSWLPGKKYFDGGICNVTRNLTNQVVIVTGSSSGIGRETVKGLAAKNATIIMATRNKAKTLPIMDAIKQETGNQNIEHIPLDLTDLNSFKAFAQEFKSKFDHLDMLVNNAGTTSMQSQRSFTKQGFEESFGVSYIGHYYLTCLLLDTIKKTDNSRIIFTSTKSVTKTPFNWDNINSEKKYDSWQAEVRAKRANLMFASELQRKLENDSVKVTSLHPGWVRSEGFNNVQAPFFTKIAIKCLYFALGYFGKDTRQGAQTHLYLALEDWKKLKGAGYYSDCEEFKFAPHEDLKPENTEKLYNLTEKWIKEKLGEDAFKI